MKKGMKKGAKPALGRGLSLLATKGVLAETSIASGCILIVAIFVALESVLRYGFSYAILGLEELTLIVGAYAYFVGSACASKDKVQIRVNIIDIVPIPQRTRRIIDLAMGFISFTVCFIFTYYAFVYCRWVLSSEFTIAPFGFSIFVATFSSLLGLGLMGVHYLHQFVRMLRRA